ncbi:MAG: DUF255 domain-containing protein [Bacillota bacterium]
MAAVEWREWGPEAFDLAAQERKPILLGISATWCHWCHVMDETTYSDREVAAVINRDFVPVRVDTDRRPDINSRYNMGGWPTTAFLTPEGEILTGATYMPPEDMKRVLDKVRTFYKEHGREITGKLRGRREEAGGAGRLQGRRGEAGGDETRGAGGPDPAGDLDPAELARAVRDITGRLEEAYDPVHGGFGVAPKFPQIAALNLLLISHLRTGEPGRLAMVERTLKAMRQGGLYDQIAGGFFRYSTTRDWEIPHFEKMLEDNAELLDLYARMARLTGNDFYLEVVVDLVRYLTTRLRSERGYFFGSQDADEAYYRLDAEGRAEREAPRVDRTLYSGWNALAARGFLSAYLATGDIRLRETGLVALETTWGLTRREDGLLVHYCDREGPAGIVLLTDAAAFSLALLDAYEATGEPDFLARASRLLARTKEVFGDDAGRGFFDTPPDGDRHGRLRVRHKDLTDNARVALALLRLADIVMDPEPRRDATRALLHFLGPHRRHGVLAAEYGLALDWAAGPTAEVTVSGRRDDPGARALFFQAAAAVSGARAVRWSFPEGEERAGAVLHLCSGERCLEPLTDPARVREAVREAGRREPAGAGEAGRREPAGAGEAVPEGSGPWARGRPDDGPPAEPRPEDTILPS